MSRKSRLKRNPGGTTAATDARFNSSYFSGPVQTASRTSITLPERLLRRVLLDEVDRLAADRAELTRFLGHFFDPTTDVEERDTYVDDFIRNPPRVVLGYPRATGDLPIFAIVLTSEDEAEDTAMLANYVGETLPGETPPGGTDQEYEGSFFSQMNSVYVFAQNPDQTLYLYHFAKLVLLGARDALHNAGLISPSYSGGELSPNEIYLPDNVFARVLNVSYTVLMSVPKLLGHADGRKLKVGGLFAEDIVIDGQRGGVVRYQETFGNDDGT